MLYRFAGFIAILVLLLQPLAGVAEFIFNDDLLEGDDVWSYPIPLSVLEDTQDVLRLINRENLLAPEYPNQDIDMYKMVKVTARVKEKGMTLRPVVNDVVTEMLAAAEEDGIILYVVSAYRNYRTQEVLHYNRLQRLSKDDGILQMAGASEHQAGLAADVTSKKYLDLLQTSFGDTKEGKWLAENCAKFGFIVRYPQGQEMVTGVRYEPWHMRYVGIEVAGYIMESGLTLEAFTEEWRAEVEKYNAQGQS